jgi:hypothetical protein
MSHEPLKADNTTRIRQLEDRLMAVERQLRDALANSASNIRQIRPAHLHPNAVSGSHVVGSSRVTSNEGGVAMSASRMRNVLDAGGNLRGYYSRSFAFDNLGPGTSGGYGNIIPPHHDMELFKWFHAYSSLDLPDASATVTTQIQRIQHDIYKQTKLTNLTLTTPSVWYGENVITATDPGSYLVLITACFPILKVKASGTNDYHSGQVQPYINGSAILAIQFEKIRGHTVANPSSEYYDERTSIAYSWVFLWTPNAGGTFSLAHVTRNAPIRGGNLGSGTAGNLLIIELGRNKALTGVNYNGGAATSGFEFSNSSYADNFTQETRDAIESGIGVIIEPT